MKAINFILNILLSVVILGVVAFLLAPRFGVLRPYELKIVRSGSMEPAILTGSVVLIRPTTEYKVGDVITFGEDTRTSIPTTHRIVSMRTDGAMTYFGTKGDANEDPDSGETPLNKVIGRVIFSLPYAGYILAFSKTQLGFSLLVLIPAGLIILYEGINITREVKTMLRRKWKKGGGGESDVATSLEFARPAYQLDMKGELEGHTQSLKVDVEMPEKLL